MYLDKQLNRARDLAYKHSGVTLANNKDIMIANRLDKLKRTLNNNDIDSILKSIENGENIETFISAFTTNKTNFFRESFHFDDLKDRIVKEAMELSQELKIYCCAASTGEEPYSILMTLENAKESYNNSLFNYSLLATDIDEQVLQTAQNGIYEWDRNKDDFPSWISPSKYFKRRVHPSKDGDFLIKIKENIRRKVKYHTMNLMSETYPFQQNEFDVIFCRNVLIYFNSNDQNKILKNLFSKLRIGGTLYLGHSESSLGLTPYVERCGQNIFLKMKDFK